MSKRKAAILLLMVVIIVIAGVVMWMRLRQRVEVGPSLPIRIGYSSLTPIHCMVGEVFSRTKILERHGLDAELVSFLHGSDQGRACKKGEIDVTFSCEVPAIIHLTECPDLRIVATPGSLGRIALLVPGESEISSPEDLGGRRIILHRGASAHLQLLRWLEDAHLVPGKDVQIVEPRKGLIEGLIDGSADAIVTWDPWLEISRREHGLRIIRERPFWSVVFVSQEYLDKSPQGAVRYLAALKEALFWAANHKDQVNQWVAEKSHLEVEDVATVASLNRNYAISAKEGDVNILLTPEHIKILEECVRHTKQFGQTSKDFDLGHYINLQIAANVEKDSS